MLKKYSWLTPSVFEELYWPYLVLAIFPVTAFFASPLPLFLVLASIIAMNLAKIEEEKQNRFKRAKQYRENREKELQAENAELAKNGLALIPPFNFGPLEIRYKAIIMDALRDLTKYFFAGLVCYSAGKIVHFLFTGMGIFSTVLFAYVKILTVLLLGATSIVLLFLLLLWLSDKAYEFTINKSEG
ncbi:MAG: hypothetical protein NTX00_05350 [Candidatus Parcubacteria bacterium]|nr:hypothetical protein [Candidatus Parcubacteria bacterium]